ncbi:MAG: B-box zinc finger protein [Candidatus Bathyarchaeia archaeon]
MVKLCEICRHKNAMYVCKNCGKEVCNECFNVDFWACSKCYELEAYQKGFQKFDSLSNTFFKFFILGFIMIFIGIVLIMLSSLTFKDSLTGGITLIIGPIPILLGFGPYSQLLLLFAMLLTIIILIVFLIPRIKI